MITDDHDRWGGPRPGPGEVDPGRRRWVEDLVELHVLSEHGDLSATAAAGRWMASDREARRVWNEVERIRDHLRAPPQATSAPACSAHHLDRAAPGPPLGCAPPSSDQGSGLARRQRAGDLLGCGADEGHGLGTPARPGVPLREQQWHRTWAR